MAGSPNVWIQVKNLRLRTYIGFNPEERDKKQDVVVNMRVCYDAAAASLSDSASEALDYKHITKAVIGHVENGRFLLLEKLAGDLLDIAMGSPRTLAAVVEVDKPHALRFADSVSVTRWGRREDVDPAVLGPLSAF